MTARDRYLRTLRFQSTDRIPLIEWPIRGATMQRWISEGYPLGIDPQTFDCGGYPGNELISLWMDAGVDAISPCEIAAGNDLIRLRKDFPTLGLYGGIDKRKLAAGKEGIDEEVFSKVPWLLERGGYIPHVDHAVPHDVPLENYIYYRKLLTRLAFGG